MNQTPYLAVVLRDGRMQSAVLEDWPVRIPRLRVVVVDYDIDGADEGDLTHFSVGGQQKAAHCQRALPDKYDGIETTLSPKAVWEALGLPDESGTVDPLEQSLIDYLTGYIGTEPARREQVRSFPDWPDMARRELVRRSARLLEALPNDALRAIAQGEVDLPRLAGKIPV
jgi:hypothetical protein